MKALDFFFCDGRRRGKDQGIVEPTGGDKRKVVECGRPKRVRLHFTEPFSCS